MIGVGRGCRELEAASITARSDSAAKFLSCGAARVSTSSTAGELMCGDMFLGGLRMLAQHARTTEYIHRRQPWNTTPGQYQVFC